MEEKRNIFSKSVLIEILESALGKTLGEVDKNNVFEKTKLHPKITGIAGDVIEQSVLGYSADSYQTPDLYVDGQDIELKTTGIRKSKKRGINYEAKEPMSITAVSPSKIVNESFENSSFWHKLDKLLLVYYLYDSDTTVTAAEYAQFPIKGYQFHEFSDEDKSILMKDWELVKDFIEKLQLEYDCPENEYYRLSSELRSKLMMIDTAPKWPNRPRFRLKRVALSTIVQKHFGTQLEQLPVEYKTFRDIDEQLQQFTVLYRGKTIEELISSDYLDIKVKLNKNEDVNKSITEQIVTKMFGAESKKISNIEVFKKSGLIAKTITQTVRGLRTEDTKLFPVDFDEWLIREQIFEESLVYSDFSENQFLFIIFEEPIEATKLLENKFVGFKRISFDEKFIENQVKACWSDVRNKVLNNQLIESIIFNKDGSPKINKNGMVSTTVNFPKSREFEVFLRGTGADSKDKPVELNGISMYRQNLWIKGTVILDMLNSVDYIENKD